MIRTTARAALAAMLLTAAFAAPSWAQRASPITFNIHAGAALPQGDFGDFVNTGFSLGGGLKLRPATLPFALRFDGTYSRFEYEAVDDNFAVWSITANAELAPAASPFYLIGGAGFYSMSDELDSETDLGVNIGGGFRLPLTGFDTFIEARYHRIFNQDDPDTGEPIRTNFIPIVFGISF